MRLAPSTGTSSRARAVALTLLVHAALLTLFVHFGSRTTRRLSKPELQFISIWPDTRPVTRDGPPVPPRPRVPQLRPEVASSRPVVATTDEPDTRAEAAPQATPSATPFTANGIDWYAEAGKAAAGASNADARTIRDFNAAPKVARKPCEPKASSWEWNSEQPKTGLLPLPYIVLADRCLIMVGFFACAIGELPPPNSHLLDDMKGRDLASSVPDPRTCE